MSNKQVYIVNSSRRDSAETEQTLVGNVVEITKCVNNAEQYVSTSREYLNASKQTIQHLKDIMVHAEVDINTAEECVLKSQRKLQDLKRELQTLFNKTFYENFTCASEESTKRNDDKTSFITTDDYNFSRDKLNGFLKKYAEDSSLDPEDYDITCQKYRGLMLVVMRQRLTSDQSSETSNESTYDSESENESPPSKIENGPLHRIYLEEQSTPTRPLIEIEDQSNNGELIPLKSDKVIQDESNSLVALEVESSKQRCQARQSISQTFFKAKLSETKSLGQNEKTEQRPTAMQNYFFPNEQSRSKMTSHAENRLQRNFKESKLLLKVVHDLDKQLPCNQNTSMNSLDERVMPVVSRQSNLHSSNNSNTRSRLNLSKFIPGDSYINLDDCSNETGVIPKKYASNSSKQKKKIKQSNIEPSPFWKSVNENRTTSSKVERLNIQTDTCEDQNQTTRTEMSKFLSPSCQNCVKRAKSVETPPNNASVQSKTILSKSASENNLIEFSPKPLSQNFKNLSCDLKNDILTDETLNPARREYSYSETIDFSEKASMNSENVSGKNDGRKFSQRQTEKKEAFNSFKPFHTSGFIQKLRSNRSDNLLPPKDENCKETCVSENVLVGNRNPLKTVKSNQTFSLPRISRECRKPDQSKFYPILDSETSESDHFDDSLVSPPFKGSRNAHFCLTEDVHCQNYDTNTFKTSGIGIFKDCNINYDNLVAKNFGQDLSETQPLNFPNGEIFSNLSESTCAQLSDHSVNNRSISLNESYGVKSSSKSEIYCNGDCRKHSSESLATTSNASPQNELQQSYDATSSPESISEFTRRPFPSIPFTDCRSRDSRGSSSLSKESFNPRLDSCSSPAPDYSP